MNFGICLKWFRNFWGNSSKHRLFFGYLCIVVILRFLRVRDIWWFAISWNFLTGFKRLSRKSFEILMNYFENFDSLQMILSGIHSDSFNIIWVMDIFVCSSCLQPCELEAIILFYQFSCMMNGWCRAVSWAIIIYQLMSQKVLIVKINSRRLNVWIRE